MKINNDGDALMKFIDNENFQLQVIALYAIEFVCSLFELEGDRPVLHIAFTEEHHAYQEEGKIVISIGAFMRARELQSLLSNTTNLPLGGLSIPAFQAASLFVFWIAAHETIHFGRCHERAPNLDSSVVRRALEYESDCLATFSLFQFTKNSQFLNSEITDEVALRLTYGVMYWHFRNYFSDECGGNSQTDTHPSWMVRSTYCFSFLVGLVTPPNEPQNHQSPEAKDRFKAAVGILTDVVTRGEDTMFEIYGGETVEVSGKLFKKSLIDFVKVFGDKNDEAKHCMREYNKILTDLDDIQRFKKKFSVAQ